MKFKFLLLLLMPVLLSKGQSFLISGNVHNDSLQPVPTWPVTIQSVPGIWPYFNDVVFTDANGHFQFTGTASDTVVIQMTVSTPDCNQLPVDTTFSISAGQGVVTSFTICISNTPEPCVASFNFFPSGDTLIGNTFQFINTSTGPFSQVMWDFGDGLTSTEPAPVHTFAAGDWNVCLVISDPFPVNNCSDAACEVVQVDSIAPCSNDFSVQLSGLNASFSGWTLYAGAVDYFWSFGDGTEGFGQIITHDYPVAGDYVVTLITQDEANCTAVSSRVITIVGGGCEALFSWSTDPAGGGLIHFADHSTGGIQEWSWNFGDGGVSAEPSPSHLFASGSWNVCLTVTGNGGLCSDVFCQVVTVADSASCEALFGWVIDPVDPLLVHFNDQSTGVSDLRIWSFGDGVTSMSLNPDHNFSQAGTYSVCLMVWSADSSCSSTKCHTIDVGEQIYFPVFGQILANFFPADEVTVQLFESVGGMPVLSDSALVGEQGAYAFYMVPQGSYLMRTALAAGSVLFDEFLPTYSGNTVLWEEASPVYVNQLVSGADIWLVPVPGPTVGNGTISGSVQWAGDGKTGLTTGMAGVPVYLFSSQGVLIQAVYTDQSGQFVFQTVPDGSFVMRPEITGLPVTPLPVSIGGAAVVVSDVTFRVSESGIQYGVVELLPAGVVSVGLPAPNPAHGKAMLEVEVVESMTMSVSLVDLSGRVVYACIEALEPGTNRLSLPAEKLRPGVYTVLLNKGSDALVVRKLIVMFNASR